MASKKTKKPALFSDFPQELFIVHVTDRNDTEDGGYFLTYTDKVEAAESAIEYDSELAIYENHFQGVARVKYDVEID